MTEPVTEPVTEPSFLERARASSIVKRPVCTVALALRDLEAKHPDQAREAHQALAGEEGLTSTAIARTFRHFGCSVSEYAVRRHQRADCKCAR